MFTRVDLSKQTGKSRMSLKSILAIPVAYRLFQGAVIGDFRRRDAREFARPRPGDKVLDIGCGPGDILEVLSDVEYVGLDLSPEYIESAKEARFARAVRPGLRRGHDA